MWWAALLNSFAAVLDSGGAGGGGSYESIATLTGDGTATSLTFSSIPSTYKHLQIRWIARSARVGVSDNLIIQFNGDTGANYANHRLSGNGTSATAGSTASTTQMVAFDSVRASGSSNTLSYGTGIIDIHDYASTTKNKTIRVLSGWDLNGSGVIALSSGFRNSTTAVTSITLESDGNAFATSSVFSLYGIKG
jgi:hypothetical protein